MEASLHDVGVASDPLHACMLSKKIYYDIL